MDMKLTTIILAIAALFAIGVGAFAMGGPGVTDNGVDQADSGMTGTGSSDPTTIDNDTQDSGSQSSEGTGSGSTDTTIDNDTQDSGSQSSEGTGSGTTPTGVNIIDTTTISGVTITYMEGEIGLTRLSSSGETILQIDILIDGASFALEGSMEGGIVVNAYSFDAEMNLKGFTITSSYNVPIYVNEGKDFDISAKSGTSNFVYDYRAEVDDSGTSASIFSDCDLTLKGTGSLTVVSQYNNGIHTKDDLTVQKLTLTVTCVDNALKGNDSVTIKSGTISLTATSGDGIKTSNTTKSSGNACGNVVINSKDQSTALTIKCLCDAIDSAADVIIGETCDSSITIKISTSTNATSVTSAISGGPGGMPSWGMNPGGWQPGGGMENGNTDKQDYSCKGIKADGTISIKNGTLDIQSYDDGLHADIISVSGGSISISTHDDGIHADSKLTINAGTITVTKSYEGLEAGAILISGGTISIVSSDDGVNSTSGGLTLSGGYLYVYAGGDGLDCNSSAIAFKGTNVAIVSTSGGNSAIDADYSYTYSGGIVLAICPTGMTGEITNCSTFKSYGTQQYMSSISKGTVVKATVGGTLMAAIQMPVSMNGAAVFYIGSTGASISTGSVSGMDDNGVYFRP